ncbi:FAD-binding oxidoreductase [Sphingomonadales bacterium 56]|uniref:FAD-binding oxidoreductase n=1 Tax=unclassified Sphingobium TaxID=2611147 RepID=UPI001918821F|nr:MULTISPECIES: FAD-binding oxidoreductase [unclassified Sphingobium]MBY2928106.1 FAD-binding oxidoreductase [Sphingomonadales bacterium 56]MBY2958206.1 FAD-binding oxidoreductase [Sphingomonadales bacterium 58]CAD7336584.1 putative FAD-linked oxidoreductase [Sphingobium sp. S6]CAD7336643.1 putative FAD-linked oxidoreductase [Sphingobium sp. S8]
MIGQEIIGRFAALLGPKGVITDPEDIAPWLTDWRGRFHGAAAAIIQPSSTQEVAAIVSLAAELRVPLVPQGGNTSMVGGATPPQDGSALILSLRRMNRIRSLSPEDNLAICEAGVILSTLHDAAEEVGRRFPLSLGAKGSATIGGLISTNAGGTQVLRHGTMRALVEGLEAVLPDGSILNGLEALKKDNRGYDLKQLLIGAEGTLGIITAASLRLVPAIAARAVAWVGVASPADALALLRLTEARLGDSVEGFEIIADDGLGHVLAHIPGTRCPIETRTPWHVLIEVDHADLSPPSPEERLETALAEALTQGIAIDAAIAVNEAQAATFWRLRESLSEAERAQGPALQFDISVPVARMPAFMIDTAAAAERTFPGTTASSFGHLGDGNVHFHVRAPKGTTDGPAWIAADGKAINAFVHDAVAAAGGSISAEHGIGQMKRAELGRLASPARLHALRAIKAAFDPLGLMNPDKLIPRPEEG